jgi:hypothetical protein
MRVVHRISVASSSSVAASLSELGVKVAASGLATFEIDESDPSWEFIKAWLQSHDAVDLPSARFSAEELEAVGWLELVPDWHHGYPQPERDFGYLRVTYDGVGCLTCGAGGRQVEPFQLKGEPKWGRRNVLQLNWVFDEYFVKPEFWSSTFEPMGVAARPVLDREGQVLQTVVQLVVDAEVDVETDGLACATCGTCGRNKFVAPPEAFSPLPRDHGIVARPIMRSRQWFGSGASAFREVLVSQELRRSLVASGIKGASFRPCGPSLSWQ